MKKLRVQESTIKGRKSRWGGTSDFCQKSCVEGGNNAFWTRLSRKFPILGFIVFLSTSFFIFLPGGVAYTPSPPVCICVCARVCWGGWVRDRERECDDDVSIAKSEF
jgi:hypothetical protein